MFTARELQDAIDKLMEETGESYLYDEISDTEIEIPGFGTTKPVAYWKEHDDGVQKYVVFEIDGRLFQMDGYHDSWVGGEWDGQLVEVESYTEEVTKYRRVK